MSYLGCDALVATSNRNQSANRLRQDIIIRKQEYSARKRQQDSASVLGPMKLAEEYPGIQSNLNLAALNNI
jgi:hypothetical protein